MLFRLFSILILSSLVLGGCSRVLPKLDEVLPDQRKEYKKSKSLPDLEVPPDLTTETIDDSLSVPDIDTNGSATFSSYQERVARQRENRQFSNVVTDSSGITELSDELLIVVASSTTDSWITLEEFWANQRYKLDLADEELGFLETNWKGTKEDLQRDKFKVFVEASESSNETLIYLTHEGEDFDQGAWTNPKRNKKLERAMAKRILTAFGGAPTSVSTKAAANTDNNVTAVQTEPEEDEYILNVEMIDAGDGKNYLAVNKDSNQIWRQVGEIIREVDDIEVRNESESKGTYDVVYVGEKKKGMLSKLAFWKGDEELQINLSQAGKNTEIIVLDKDGKWDDSETARQILLRIQKGL